MKNFTSPSVSLRVIGDRGAIMGYFGFQRMGYKLLDLAVDVSRVVHDRPTYGYLSLIKACSIDYLKDKDDEVKDQTICFKCS